MKSVLLRQDYFELIPSRSNYLQPVRGLLGCGYFFLSTKLVHVVAKSRHELRLCILGGSAGIARQVQR
jgi:hypothetical protein